MSLASRQVWKQILIAFALAAVATGFIGIGFARPAHASAEFGCDMRCGLHLQQRAVPAKSASARRQHTHRARGAAHWRNGRAVRDANGNRAGIVTVSTTAGIDITVATDFAPKAQAVIADAEAQGIHLRRIKCFSATGHVPGSNHHTGRACDTRPFIPASIVREHGLRSGRDFHDPEHFDDATNVGGIAFWNSLKHRGSLTASAERRHQRHSRRHRHHRRYQVARR